MKMHMGCPEDGIKIKISTGNLYFGYTFSRFEGRVSFYLHIHFSPDTNQEWISFLLEKLKPFLESRYQETFKLAWILRESYQIHGYEVGCVNGLPFSLDPNNPRIKGMIDFIQEDCDDLKHILKNFLEEVLKD